MNNNQFNTKNTDLPPTGNNRSIFACAKVNRSVSSFKKVKNTLQSGYKYAAGLGNFSHLRNALITKEKPKQEGSSSEAINKVNENCIRNSSVIPKSIRQSGFNPAVNRHMQQMTVNESFRSKIKGVPQSSAVIKNETSGRNRVQTILTSGGNTRASEFFVAIVENTARVVGMAAFSLFSGTVLLLGTVDNCLYENTISFLRSIKPRVILLRKNPGILNDKLDSEFADSKTELMGSQLSHR